MGWVKRTPFPEEGVKRSSSGEGCGYTLDSKEISHLFYNYYQNPSGFCYLVQNWAFVIQNSLGLPNLNTLN